MLSLRSNKYHRQPVGQDPHNLRPHDLRREARFTLRLGQLTFRRKEICRPAEWCHWKSAFDRTDAPGVDPAVLLRESEKAICV